MQQLLESALGALSGGSMAAQATGGERSGGSGGGLVALAVISVMSMAVGVVAAVTIQRWQSVHLQAQHGAQATSVGEAQSLLPSANENERVPTPHLGC
jgi:hypothetical protein